jgi:hypothetical protein
MHLPFLTLLSTLAPLALGAPTLLVPRTNTCAIPISSFSVLNFRSFDAAPGPTGVSSVSFTLTSASSPAPIICECSMPAGSNLSAANAHRWITCKSDGSVKFDYGGEWLALSESYECMG